MSVHSKLARSLIAVVAAVAASALTVGAAVGPAQAVNSTSQVAINA